MGEPRAITYKEVEKAGVASPSETWREIGRYLGAGDVAVSARGNASIDLTNESDAARKHVDEMIAKAAAAAKADKKKAEEK